MPQSTNVLSFISPHSGEATSRKGSPESHGQSQNAGADDALRRIAEAALSATSASGAALALNQQETQAEGVVVCVARAGEMAPPIGAKLDSRSGISGECLRTGQALHCEDTETDARVDRQACRSLGLRSLAIAPVKRGDQVVGILEVFSARPDAFNSRHLDVLRQLTELVLDDFDSANESNLGEASDVALDTKAAPTLVPAHAPYAPTSHEPPPEAVATAEQALANPVAAPPHSLLFEEHAPVPLTAVNAQTPATPTPNEVNIAAYMAAEEAAHSQAKPKTPFVVLIGLAGVLLFAALLALVWRKMATQTPDVAAGQPVQTAAISAAAKPVSVVSTPETPSKPDAGTPQNPDVSATRIADSRSGQPPLTKASARDVVRRSSDVATDTTSDVTRPIRVVNSAPRSADDSDTAPAINASNQSGQLLSSLINVPPAMPRRVAPISQGVQGGELVRRVEPLYPLQAKTLRQQGTVVLQAFVAETGLVREVRVVSGPPILGQAAVDAVKQWRYKPFQLNGKPVEMETQVKVAFRLP